MWIRCTIGPTKPRPDEVERHYFVEGSDWGDIAWRTYPFIRDGETLRAMDALAPTTHFIPLNFDEGMRAALSAIEEAYDLNLLTKDAQQ